MKKVGKILGNVVVTLILIFSILMTVAVISSTKDDSGLPNLFGKAIFNVLTDSMMSETGFDEGSLIVVELTDSTRKEPYKVGDVVTFWRYYQDEAYLETHRIIADTYTTSQNEVVDGIWVHGGTPYYVVALNAARNEVVVGFKEDTVRFDFDISDVVGGESLQGELAVKIRSGGEPKGPVTVRMNADGSARVFCTSGISGVAPGQSAVFYRGDEVIGGGIILANT